MFIHHPGFAYLDSEYNYYRFIINYKMRFLIFGCKYHDFVVKCLLISLYFGKEI